MMSDVKSRWVLITGAASGIGYETALCFARAGANVVATDISLQGLLTLQHLLEKLPVKTVISELDVTKEADFIDLIERLREQAIELDIIVNNAGIAWIGNILEHNSDIWQRVFSVNVMGVVNGVRAVLPLFRQSSSPKHIVNVSSVAGMCPPANLSAYAASKAAVLNFTDNLGIECLGTNIGVTCVHPGIINTPIVDAKTHGESITQSQLDHLQRYYDEKGVKPSQVASDILNAVLTNNPRLMTGTGATLAHALKRLLPTRTFWKACRKASLEAGYLNERT